MFENNNWLAGGAIIGLLMSCWHTIQSFLWQMVGLVVQRHEMTGPLAEVCNSYLLRHGRWMPTGSRLFSSLIVYIRPMGKQGLVAVEQPRRKGGMMILGKIPLMVTNGGLSYGDSQIQHVSTQAHAEGFGVTLSFLRGTFDPKAFMWKVLQEVNAPIPDRSVKRFRVRRVFGDANRFSEGRLGKSPGGDSSAPTQYHADSAYAVTPSYVHYKPDALGAKAAGEPFEALALSEECEDALLSIRRWFNAEEWYKLRCIPWQRGYLLTGPPGTGKTSFARAVARELDLPVHVFDLTTFGNEDFSREWDSALTTAPCIVLIEDIDGVFEGRQNRSGRDHALSFDCLLNCISGIGSNDGVLLLVTTNHPETLDPALGRPSERGGTISTRPGRVDHVITFGPLTEKQRREVAERILSDIPAEDREQVIAAGDGDSGAQFQARCEPVALEKFWAETHPGDEKARRDRVLTQDLVVGGKILRAAPVEAVKVPDIFGRDEPSWTPGNGRAHIVGKD